MVDAWQEGVGAASVLKMSELADTGTAVYRQGRTCNESGPVGCKKGGGVGDIPGRAHFAPERYAFVPLCDYLLPGR